VSTGFVIARFSAVFVLFCTGRQLVGSSGLDVARRRFSSASGIGFMTHLRFFRPDNANYKFWFLLLLPGCSSDRASH
jgi:hypothetical protein